MPREDRRIIFDGSEVYKAIYALCVQKEMRKPIPGIVESVALDPQGTEYNVRIVNSHNETSQDMQFSAEFLIAAMMLYCRSLNIPMSKRASKSLELEGRGVVLRLQM